MGTLVMDTGWALPAVQARMIPALAGGGWLYFQLGRVWMRADIVPVGTVDCYEISTYAHLHVVRTYSILRTYM